MVRPRSGNHRSRDAGVRLLQPRRFRPFAGCSPLGLKPFRSPGPGRLLGRLPRLPRTACPLNLWCESRRGISGAISGVISDVIWCNLIPTSSGTTSNATSDVTSGIISDATPSGAISNATFGLIPAATSGCSICCVVSGEPPFRFKTAEPVSGFAWYPLTQNGETGEGNFVRKIVHVLAFLPLIDRFYTKNHTSQRKQTIGDQDLYEISYKMPYGAPHAHMLV